MRAWPALACGLAACSTPAPLVAPEPAVAAPTEAGYLIQDRNGQLVGRLHTRWGEKDGHRTIVTRTVWGKPVATASELSAQRTEETALVFRDDLSPVSFKRLSSERGRLLLSFDRGFINVSRGAEDARLTDATPKAPMLLALDPAMMQAWLRNSGLEPGQSRKFVVRQPDALRAEPVSVQLFVDGQMRRVAKFEGRRYTLDDQGIVRVEAPGGVVLIRQAEAGTPPRLLPVPEPLAYHRPAAASFSDRPVVIEVAGGRLEGVRSQPRGAGPHPAVVFAPDLGRPDRHGFAQGVDTGSWQIFDALAEAGFEVLRLDARGAGSSQAPTVGVDHRRLSDDLVAAWNLLQGADVGGPAVAATRPTFIVGHGFGAFEAMALVAKVEAAGLVLLAPAARPAGQVLGQRYQVIEGLTPDAAQKEGRLVALALGGSEAARAEVDATHLAALELDASRLASLATIDLRQLSTQVDEPTAVYQGLRDFEVSWREDAKQLVDSMNRRQRGQVELHVYDFADHHLMNESAASHPERYRRRGRALEARFVGELTAWMKARSSRSLGE